MTTTKYLTARQVAERYSVSDMTLWRWLNDDTLKFPKPMVIRRRRLFDADALDVFDARQQSEVAA